MAHGTQASRMRLCVFGIESLDTLETAVSESFSAIKPSPSVPQLDFARCGMPLKREAEVFCLQSRLQKAAQNGWLPWGL